MQSQEDIKKYLEKRLRENHVFWSFEQDATARLSDWNLIKYVLIHLDLDDINYLFKIYPKKKIKKVWIEELIPQGEYLISMNICFALIYFDAKNPRIYVNSLMTRQFNKKLKNEGSAG